MLLPLPLPVRLTVVRLGNGEMWLHSPTRFDGRLRRDIETPERVLFTHGAWIERDGARSLETLLRWPLDGTSPRDR